MIDMIRIKAPVALSILIAGSWLGLSGCQSDPVLVVDLCQPYDGLTPLCGYQSPEDLAVLPDSSGLLVSEFGHMGETQGQLSILSIADHSRKVIYAVSYTHLTLPTTPYV